VEHLAWVQVWSCFIWQHVLSYSTRSQSFQTLCDSRVKGQAAYQAEVDLGLSDASNSKYAAPDDLMLQRLGANKKAVA